MLFFWISDDRIVSRSPFANACVTRLFPLVLPPSRVNNLLVSNSNLTHIFTALTHKDTPETCILLGLLRSESDRIAPQRIFMQNHLAVRSLLPRVSLPKLGDPRKTASIALFSDRFVPGLELSQCCGKPGSAWCFSFWLYWKCGNRSN
jgi:hypothetical protein